jgi:diguanylate cyclase (GGDEF)-like protein
VGAIAAAAKSEELTAGAEERLASFAELVATAIANAETWERLARDATTDAVTGIANNRAFRERLELEAVAAERHGRPLSVVVFDVDRFKQINDTFGHQTGDRILAEAARVLAQQARRHELVARLGGEEFGWILPDTDTAGAFAAAERARVAVERHDFADAGRITVSAGVGSLDVGRGPESLMRLADDALYRAKAAGRNRTDAAHARPGGASLSSR